MPSLPLLPLVLADVPPGLRRALAQEGLPAADRRPGAPAGRFLLFDSRGKRRPEPAPGQVPIDVDLLRRGWKEDPFVAMMDPRSARAGWKIGGLTVTEEVARVDKRQVRRRLLAGLREAVENAGGVWLRVAAFPFPFRSAFSFRIDYDEYDPGDFDAVQAAVAGHEAATSHFVCGAAFQRSPDALARLRGLDVGSHGYWHHTYRTAEENLTNIRRGIEVLDRAGIEPSGFAAPHGRWSPGLADVLAKLGVSHSSEFGLAYDDVPFFPNRGELVQVPVHPVCLGVVLEAARAAAGGNGDDSQPEAAAVEAAIDHFRRFAGSRYRAGDPVLLYGHPTGRLGRYPQVLRDVLQTAAGFAAIWRTTFSELALWWRARDRVKLSVVKRDDGFVVTAATLPSGYRLGIEYLRGEHVALLPLDRAKLAFNPATLGYENRNAPSSFRPVRVDRSHGLRGHVRRMIDWERVTPAGEIAPAGWRNWAKKTLRQWGW